MPDHVAPSSDEAVVCSTLDGVITSVGPAAEILFGYSEAEVVGESVERLDGADPQEWESLAAMVRRGATIHLETTRRRKDHSAISVRLTASPMRDERGVVGGVRLTHSTVQGALPSLDAVRVYADTVQSMPLALYVWRLERPGDPAAFRLVAANPAATTFAQKPLQRLLGRTLPEIFPALMQSRLPTQYLDVLHRNTMCDLGDLECVAAHEDPGTFAVRAVPLGSDTLGVLLEDVTERRRLEARNRQTHKMETVGRLAGGIAHDFNNLLTAILGYSDLLLDDVPQADVRRQHVMVIRHAAETAAGLTRQLLAFSRKQILRFAVVDLNDVLRQMEDLLRRLIGEDIELVISAANAVAPVRVDSHQIEQVVLNLAVNARDAMPDGGRLLIETSEVVLDGEYGSRQMGAKPGRYVRLAVSDTGVGMDPETQAHIFEPFYTTKTRESGTGLGLSTVYGIVKQSDGNIWLNSETGRGTTFEVFLPWVEETSPVRERPQEPVEAARGTETILVVEDDGQVRRLAGDLLRARGYTVHEAASGAQAAALVLTLTTPIHLLLSDVVMRGMSGPVLADQLRLSHPETRVLFMSGYTDELAVRQGVDDTALFLEKPFTADSLAKTVRAALG